MQASTELVVVVWIDATAHRTLLLQPIVPSHQKLALLAISFIDGVIKVSHPPSPSGLFPAEVPEAPS